MTKIDDILAEREETHGSYAEVAQVAQALKRVMHGAPNWPRLRPTQKETLEMAATKFGRLLCGNPNELEHYKDAIGYLTLVVKDLEAGDAPD